MCNIQNFLQMSGGGENSTEKPQNWRNKQWKNATWRRSKLLTDQNLGWLSLALTVLTCPRETDQIPAHTRVTRPLRRGTTPAEHQLWRLAAVCGREQPDARHRWGCFHSVENHFIASKFKEDAENGEPLTSAVIKNRAERKPRECSVLQQKCCVTRSLTGSQIWSGREKTLFILFFLFLQKWLFKIQAITGHTMFFRKRLPANGKAQHTDTTKKTNSERVQTNLKNKREDLALPCCCYARVWFEQVNQGHLDEGDVT